MADFYEDLGYQLPSEVGEVKSESFEYYKHEAGVYNGFIGKTTVKYKNLEGKKVEEGTAGARPSHLILSLWITEFLGTSQNPKNVPILSVGEDKIHIPAGIQQAAELYFPFMLSLDPKFQWAIQSKLQDFNIPGHDNLRLVKVNPAKMTEKITNFQALPYYYGMPIKFTLDIGEKKGGIYLSKIIQGDLAKRVQQNLIMSLEEDFNALIQREIDARKSKKDDGYIQNPPPSVDFDNLLNEADEYSS